MINKTVIVTALFDIGRDKWSGFQQSYGTYLFWMKNLLNIESEFVIYTEEKFLEQIRSIRKEVDPTLEKTKIIVENFEDIYSYQKFYERIKSLMKNDSFKKKIHFNVPEMIHPEYNTIIFNKLNFIKRTIEKYDYDMYLWCDAGILRDNSNNGKTFPNIEKITSDHEKKITFFSHDTNFQIQNRELHLLSQYRYIHGGCFFVPKNSNLNLLINYFENMVEKYLNLEFVGSEEKYYDFCFLDNKEEFNIIKSDWRQYFDIFG